MRSKGPILWTIMAFLSAAAVAPASAQISDYDTVLQTLTTFFDGFAEGDSTKMYSQVDRGGRLVVTTNDAEGNPVMRPIGMEDFVKVLSSPREQPLKETFWNPEIRVEDNLAAVWVEYNLWVGDTVDHCGTDHFQLFRSTDGWKIIAVADTQRRTGCEAHR